jgi:hypothetical protein
LFQPVIWLIAALTTSLAVVGAVVASRVPHNRVGPLLLLAGLLMALAVVLHVYEQAGSAAWPAWPGVPFAMAIGPLAFWYPILVTIVAVPLVFPGGHAPTRRETIVGWSLLAAVIAGTIAAIFSTPTVGSADDANTLLIPDALPFLGNVITLSLVVIFACAAMAAWTLWGRFRGPDPVVRQQTKWLLATVVPVVPALAISQAPVPEPVPTAGYFVALMTTLAMPVAIGFAITRYRLYEIDRIISRTIGWAVVTGSLVAVFAVATVALQALLDDLTRGETLAVAGSTLLAAALFQPLRTRIQRAVDRRFDRSRVDAERTAAAFAERLRGEVAIEAVSADLQGTIEQSLRPVRQSLWLRRAGQ